MTRRHASLVAFSVLSLLAGRAAAEPSISRAEIIDIAVSGVGSPYVWGGGCWDPSNRSWRGADCSGFVGKCWQVPTASAVTSCSHPYSTYNFYSERTHWDAISTGDLRRADSMVYRADGAGHIVLWASGDPWGNAEVYEARGTAYGIVHRTRTFSSSYRARRRHSLVADGPPPHPVLELDVAIDTLDGQERDLCTLTGSEGLFDAYVGQELTERFYVSNEGDAVAADVVVGIEIDADALHLLRWEIFDDWGGNSCGGSWCPNDSNSHPDNPAPESSGETLSLHLYALSPGETKMIVLDLTVVSDSFAAGATPGVRFWVRSVRDFYSKGSFNGEFDNVGDYQTFNGGDLRRRSRHTFLADELCNGIDDDCDGDVDDGFAVSEPCSVGLGSCAAEGVTVCSEGGDAICDAVAGEPVDEVCGNGLDDDCDGTADGTDDDCAPDPDSGTGTEPGDPDDVGQLPRPILDEEQLTSLDGSCSCRATGRLGSPPTATTLLRSLLPL